MIQQFYFWVFIQKKWNHYLQKDICTHYVHCSIIHNSQYMEVI